MRSSGHTHFVGIGGAGMSSLAAILLEAGESVSGCDAARNAWTQILSTKGARVFDGHSADHLQGARQLVVTGPAMGTDEVIQARERDIPVLRRAELLGRLMDERRGVAVAGTHGKTTTTSLLASMLLGTDLDPTVLIGGVPAGWELGGRFGRGEWLVAEADEYDRSFLQLHPEVAVVTSIEMDHPDIYRDLADLQEAFERFLRGMRPQGTVLVHEADTLAVEVARKAAERGYLEVQTYGLGKDADWRAVREKPSGGGFRFTLAGPEETIEDLKVPLPGKYNLQNATGAAAAARVVGASQDGIRRALAEFRGVGRRWETKGEARGVLVIDDYAHHPGALLAALSAARTFYPERQVWVAFQPHTYSRTRQLLHEFADALRLADRAYVLDVYAAREQPVPEITGERLAALIPNGTYAGGVAQAAERISDELQEGVLLLTVGAGDVTALGPQILSRLRARHPQ